MDDPRPLVWLPYDVDEVPDLPPELRYETFRAQPPVPDTVDEVAFYVPAYMVEGDLDVEVIASMRSLEVVQSLLAGVDRLRPHVPDGVVLCNGRGIHNASTAELGVALMLAAQRGIPEFVRSQDRGHWEPLRRDSLADRTVLVVGHGDIGRALERRLDGFEVDLVRVARTPRDGVHGYDDLPGLLPRADVVVLLVPLTDETRGLVDADFLARMRDGALLVNLARGAVVDTEALVAALHAGHVRAALDVTDPEPLPEGHPLWEAPGLLLSPHVGGASSAMRPRAHALLAEQLRRFADGRPLANVMTGAY